jgi:hypothetical protein
VPRQLGDAMEMLRAAGTPAQLSLSGTLLCGACSNK